MYSDRFWFRPAKLLGSLSILSWTRHCRCLAVALLVAAGWPVLCAQEPDVTPPPVTPAIDTPTPGDPPPVRVAPTPHNPVAAPPTGEISGNQPLLDAATGDYLLQPGDLLKIYVQGMSDLTLESRISPSGQLYYPFVRQLKAAGKTVDQVADLIEAGLRERNLKQPSVAIIVQEYAKRFAYIMGEVRQPRDIEIPINRAISLDQAIAMAGGLTKNAAEHRVQVSHREANGEITTRTIDTAMDTTDPHAVKILLQPNDTVYVPNLGGVYVVGKVNRQGYIGAETARNYAGELVSASQAISLAEGFAEDADPENASVRRVDPVTGESKVLKINLTAVIDRAQMELDIPLQAGDTLVIPPKAGVFVMGEINKPGKYFGDSTNPLTVTRAISLAGGFKQYAQPSRVKLYRRGKVPLTVNVTAILNNEELDRDVELQPGDILFIPESGL